MTDRTPEIRFARLRDRLLDHAEEALRLADDARKTRGRLRLRATAPDAFNSETDFRAHERLIRAEGRKARRGYAAAAASLSAAALADSRIPDSLRAETDTAG